MRKSKNRYFYHISASPGDAPGAITLNVVWMEREFDAYKFSAACAHITISVSEIERDICEKNRHFIIPFCIRRPRWGSSRRNIGTPFGMEKIEWFRYPMVKKFRKYVYSFWRDPRTWRTDGQTQHHIIYRAYAYAHRAVKSPFSRTAAHIFVSPGDAPTIITQYVAWMERQFNACQTSRSMYVSVFNSFRVIRC